MRSYSPGHFSLEENRSSSTRLQRRDDRLDGHCKLVHVSFDRSLAGSGYDFLGNAGSHVRLRRLFHRKFGLGVLNRSADQRDVDGARLVPPLPVFRTFISYCRLAFARDDRYGQQFKLHDRMCLTDWDLDRVLWFRPVDCRDEIVVTRNCIKRRRPPMPV